MGTESEMVSSDYKVNVNGGTEDIAISNLPLNRYFNPTIEVTANYADTSESVQAEIYSGNDKVAGDLVTVSYTHLYAFNKEIFCFPNITQELSKELIRLNINEFIKLLREENKTIFLPVTHDSELIELADKKFILWFL